MLYHYIESRTNHLSKWGNRARDHNEKKINNKKIQQSYLRANGIISTSGRDLSQHDFEQLNHYMSSEKRTITFNGEALHEITNMTDDIISFNGFTGCYVSILSSATTREDLNVSFLFQWVKEKHVVMYLKLNAEKDVVSFALLHKTDRDPFKQHKKPVCIGLHIYIYKLS